LILALPVRSHAEASIITNWTCGESNPGVCFSLYQELHVYSVLSFGEMDETNKHHYAPTPSIKFRRNQKVKGPT